MIEHQTINGREAAVAYFDDDFSPVDKGTAGCLVKIIFDDDGEMVLLRAPGKSPSADNEPMSANDDNEEHEHDGGAWDKHRVRTGRKKTIKIHGHTLATWARNLAHQDYQRIKTAISVGLTAGEDNTDIAHRVIGSRRNNGANGATEITRQHISRLGHGLLLKRKTHFHRMRGA